MGCAINEWYFSVLEHVTVVGISGEYLMYPEYYGEKLYELKPPPWKIHHAFPLILAASIFIAFLFVKPSALSYADKVAFITVIVAILVAPIARKMYDNEFRSSKKAVLFEQGVYCKQFSSDSRFHFLPWSEIEAADVKFYRAASQFSFYPYDFEKYLSLLPFWERYSWRTIGRLHWLGIFVSVIYFCPKDKREKFLRIAKRQIKLHSSQSEDRDDGSSH